MPMICAGIDGGSRAIKVALVEAGSLELLGAATADQGVDHDGLALRLFDGLLSQHGLGRGDVARIIATGYARSRISVADSTVTEITCHAHGVRRLAPDAMTIVEIGGQDSKLLRLEPGGSVRDFAMNDRCAAGTGRFLEVVAARLETRLEELGELAARSRNPATISSTCVVFAETEIIGLLASGVAREDIIAGVQNAIAHRVAAMAGRGLAEPIIFSGGVAMVPGMCQALQMALGAPVRVAPQPQITGALGAAVLAAKQARK
jgi:(R)-2-hydroxyacyl-CoA dehydratese activating ATPase